MTVVKRYQSERASRGISIREASVEIGISFSSLARIERGEGCPSAASERAIRRWMGDDIAPEHKSLAQRVADLEKQVRDLMSRHTVEAGDVSG